MYALTTVVDVRSYSPMTGSRSTESEVYATDAFDRPTHRLLVRRVAEGVEQADGRRLDPLGLDEPDEPPETLASSSGRSTSPAGPIRSGTSSRQRRSTSGGGGV